MLYNRCAGIYKFGNNTYPRRIRRRSNLGHIFPEKSASYGPDNTVYCLSCNLASCVLTPNYLIYKQADIGTVNDELDIWLFNIKYIA
jgi:hypothetical protein